MEKFNLNVEPLEMEAAGLAKGSLAGKVAVVTGGASNIGLGYARGIAWAGAKVAVLDVNEENGKNVEALINHENGPDTCLFVKCDLTSPDDVKSFAEKVFAKFGKVDLLINNAMNMRLNGKILESPVSDLDASYAISGRGVALLIKEFVPGMIERGYGVVTYSATQFHYLPPMAGGTIYTAGKAAATSLVMSLANEVKGTGVNVFCLTPAGVGRFDFSKMPPPPPPAEGEPAREMPKFDMKMFGMPGFNSMIPPEAAGAAMVYCINNAEKLHGTGFIINDAFVAMDFPFPNKETAPKKDTNSRRLTDMELTMVLCTMGDPFQD